ncbi:MAG: ABC transporter substrate-binding protein [Pseudomonadales bacterium]|nr:ABC transporter substrate-binding protein [Pseudomonadales bacterium]
MTATRSPWTRGARSWLFGPCALVLCMLLLALPVVASAATRSAEERVQEVSDAVLALIEEARGYAKEDPERFYREVTALLDDAVDFDSFARSVMAVHYRAATPEQRRRFSDSFKWGLVRTYSLALTEFSNGVIRVLPPSQPARDPKRHTVRMEVTTPSGSVYPVQYSMAVGRNGDWQVRNIIVNGVNIGLTYRNQFTAAMNDPRNSGSLDKVIDGWSDMLASEAAELEKTLSGQQGAGS